MRIAAFLLATLCCAPALAHDEQADGSPVPAWVRKACCGPQDYHPLRADQVHALPDGWHVDGYREPIAYGSELPSPDGSYAAFWIDFKDGRQSRVFCFFVPPHGF